MRILAGQRKVLEKKIALLSCAVIDTPWGIRFRAETLSRAVIDTPWGIRFRAAGMQAPHTCRRFSSRDDVHSDAGARPCRARLVEGD